MDSTLNTQCGAEASHPAADPSAATITPPRAALDALDILWFQVGGTVCNLACSHCFISCSPTNHTHDFMSLAAIRPYLAEGAGLGVKEYYFTGGEPFLNPEMEAILAATLEVGPATVLTNGLLLDPDRCRHLAALSKDSDYSLDFRVSMDGFDAASNDPIRGDGTFVRILRGIRNLDEAGLNPVITVTKVHNENGSDEGKQRFFDLLGELGISRPRLKILPVFQMGAEAERSGAYQSCQHLRDFEEPVDGWSHLQCTSCRMVTDQGVWVCPILVNEPEGRMGERLADTLEAYPLAHPACWTCHMYGVTCTT